MLSQIVMVFLFAIIHVIVGLDIANKNHILHRRQCISQTIMASSLILMPPESKILSNAKANAAETIGKDPNCNDASCLGVWDGLLADCPHDNLNAISLPFGTTSGCASSQDDTPGVFAEPWDYSDAILRKTQEEDSYDEEQMNLLISAIQLVSAKRGDLVDILMKEGRYLRVKFTDANTLEESIGEFYFTPNDTTVQFRVSSLLSSSTLQSKDYPPSRPRRALLTTTSSIRNIDRCELIRKQLRYTKLPVLRNRKRALFFVESDWDTFGPGSASLGPPAEMTTGELEGRGSDDVDPNLKIDILQNFPMSRRP